MFSQLTVSMPDSVKHAGINKIVNSFLLLCVQSYLVYQESKVISHYTMSHEIFLVYLQIVCSRDENLTTRSYVYTDKDSAVSAI